MDPSSLPPQPARRNFITRAAAIVIGGLIALVAPLAGLFVFLDPLRRKTEIGGAVRVTSLHALPENGEPRKFSIQREQVDIWNRTPDVPVGAVYLQRFGDKQVRALNAKCPHAGCFVNFKGGPSNYHCPCHDSTFAVDGRILDPKSASPRGLDELQVEIRGTEVWVRFQNFRPGVTAKIPV